MANEIHKKQAGAIAGISPERISQLIRQGVLKAGTKRAHVDRDSLYDWMEERRKATTNSIEMQSMNRHKDSYHRHIG